jgi:hypothetical protein
MADRLSILEYDDVLGNAALEAAKARVKAYNQVNKELSPDAAEDMTKKYYKDFLSKLKKAYPYESASRDDLSAIKNYDAGKMADYLYQYGIFNRTAKSPTEHAKAIKAADILPLLQGVAKPGADWMSMDNIALKQFGLDHGYDVKTKEGFSKLLNDIGEQQINYDRAQIAKEAKEEMGWSYGPRKIIAPSAMQEFENALMTGGDYDAWDAAKMGALDAGVNTLTWEAPGLFIGKGAPAKTLFTRKLGLPITNNSIANGVMGAATQAGAEAGRQGLEVGLSENGQGFDLAPVVFAGGAGATRPAIVGTVQGAVARVPGESMAQLSRGIGKSLKMGDPAAREAEQLAKSVLEYNKNVAKHNTLVEETASTLKELVKQTVDNSIAKKGIVPDPERYQQAMKILDEATAKSANTMKPIISSRSVEPLAKVERSIAASKLPEKAKVLGVAPEADGTYNAAKILEAYNKPLYAQQSITGGTARFGSPNYVTKTFHEPVRVLDNESIYEFRQMFPAKYSDEAALNGWTKTGLAAGKVLGGFGSRAEPTFKLKADKVGVEKTYKDEEWYDKLTPRSKKIIDEAFKKKAEEEYEEE